MKQQLKAGTYLGMMYYFFLVLSGAVLAWAFYLFSYMARFECTVKEALKKSLFMMLANLGWSILLVAVFYSYCSGAGTCYGWLCCFREVLDV